MPFALPALLMALGSLFAAQAEPTCTRSNDCQQLALDAAARQDFETFHSLAWRAVQTGKPNDADLMFMLARAQALSGRPDDALVMLGRLADRGFPHPEVETLDDFRGVRDMAGWPNVLEKIHATASSSAPPTAASPASPAAAAEPRTTAPETPAARPAAKADRRAAAAATPKASSPSSERADAPTTTMSIEPTIAVPTAVGTPIAMAYDKVSARLIIADDSTGTLKVVSELSGNEVDLVSRGWGGGYRTNALVIDAKRGDLWVAGTRIGEAPESVLHHVQLISGRLLYTVPSPEDSGATRFAAIAMSGASVFVLDAEGGRIFELSGAAKTLRLRTGVKERDLKGLTLASDTVAYVAHAGGILRVDLANKRSVSVSGATGIALDGIEWIGYFENSLVAVQRRSDGAMAAMRFRLDRRGRTVAAADTFGAAAATGAAILGDTFFFVAPRSEGSAVARVNLRTESRSEKKR